MIGGESEENPSWMINGHWIEFAKQVVIHIRITYYLRHSNV